MASSNPPQDLEAQIAYISKEKKETVTKLAQESRKIQALPSPDREPAISLLPRLEAFLNWLENINISPILKTRGRIDDILKLLYANDSFHFSDHHATRARLLVEKWQAQNWGAPPAVPRTLKRESDESDDASLRPQKQQRVRKADSPMQGSSTTPSDGSIMPVPRDHPIWGVHGIMHGIAHKKTTTGRKSKVLDPDYEHEKRNARVFGHNDITVGRWFPFQICALFHGAHGTSQSGICGDPREGAYSIVVAGMYDDLDRDTGDKLLYSGTGSHDNEDPGRVADATGGTQSLHASIRSRRPVRVLRSYSGKSRWAPTKGLRYDGLYFVEAVWTSRNAKGGLYEQFELRRLTREEDDLQIPLERCKARPNGQDLRDYDRIENGYTSRRD